MDQIFIKFSNEIMAALWIIGRGIGFIFLFTLIIGIVAWNLLIILLSIIFGCLIYIFFYHFSVPLYLYKKKVLSRYSKLTQENEKLSWKERIQRN